MPDIVKNDASSQGHLQRNALGLVTTAAMTAAFMGPALSVYAVFGPMTKLVGAGVGFVTIAATVITLLSAISFGMLAKEMPTAGGLYTWSRAALGEMPGLWLGLTTAAYFGICVMFPPIVFGDFFRELLEQFGVPPSNWTWLAGALTMLLLGAFITYRGILVSSHMALALLLIELLVMLALSITFMVHAVGQGTFSFAPLTFSACDGGWRGVFLALPLGVICMTCDAAVPASEETRNAGWTIPLAVIGSCFLVGIWYVFCFWAFALGCQPSDAAAPEGHMVGLMAARAWGPMKFLVSLTAMSAALGGFIPGMTAASRMIFAMARDGKLPSRLAALHPTLHAPWNALTLLFATTMFGVIPAVFVFGSEWTVEWWGQALGWFIGVVYFSANVCNIVFYWRFARERFHVMWNFLIPLAMSGAQLAILWQTTIVALSDHGGLGYSVQAFILAASTVTALYVIWRD